MFYGAFLFTINSVNTNIIRNKIIIIPSFFVICFPVRIKYTVNNDAIIINIHVTYTIFLGKWNGLIMANIPTTIVASANTVHKISHTASESSCLFTALNAKSSSGITVPIHITRIHIKTGFIQSAVVMFIHDTTTKCAHKSNTQTLQSRHKKFVKRFPFGLISGTSFIQFLNAK